MNLRVTQVVNHTIGQVSPIFLHEFAFDIILTQILNLRCSQSDRYNNSYLYVPSMQIKG